MSAALIRRALPEDAIALAHVYGSAFADATTTVDREWYVDVLGSTHYIAYVAEGANSIVGFLILEHATHAVVHSRNPIKLWQLYVTPECHGLGVATKLMEVAKDYAREHGHDVIWLGVSPDNLRAIAFYRKHGFESLGQHEVGSGDHAHQDTVMSLSLSV